MKQSTNTNNFIQGPILAPLLKFTLPVLAAMLIQSLYGAVDLLIVGRFGTSMDVSGVATGSHILHSITLCINSLAMGTTILLGQKIGSGRSKEGGDIVGSSIVLFSSIAITVSILLPLFAPQLSSIMNAPPEALNQTISYIRICGAGTLVISAYNIIGCVFRGIGDANTPMITVMIASVCNIIGDLLLVAGMGMGASGAAIATVISQGFSVVLSFFLISKKTLPFEFHISQIKPDRHIITNVLKLGTPIALQDLLVNVSFLVIMSIANSLGLVASAGVGVAERVCGFIMLVPVSFMQATSAFVAQNIGAGQQDRAKKSLWYSMSVSFAVSIVMFTATIFGGEIMAGIFSNDEVVVSAAADYLRAYGYDCLLTAIFFCFTGFFNGVGLTTFVMIQGIVGAFFVRVPVSYLMSKITPVSLFRIGMATPASSMVQVILCVCYYIYINKNVLPKYARKDDGASKRS